MKNVMKKQLFCAIDLLGGASLKVELLKIIDYFFSIINENYNNVLVIPCFHRVSPNFENSYPSIPPDIFEELIVWLNGKFEICTFSEIKSRPKGNKPLMVISFDDGYRDFIQYTVPILKKYNIKVNQNLVPASVDSGLPPLNVEIQEFILSAPQLLINEFPINVFTEKKTNITSRNSLAIIVSALMKKMTIVRQLEAKKALGPYMQKFDGFKPTPVMSLAEVKQISDLHEIGAHSYEHATMGVETNVYLQRDCERCKQYFNEKIGIDPQIYAFPNGLARKEQETIPLYCGFKYVLNMNEHFSCNTSVVHDRFNIYGSTLGEVKLRSLGLLQFPRFVV